jgi:hypothetical protein
VPSHIIRLDEVDAWLADSVNKVVTYHRTTDEAAQEILERGVDISRSRIAAYGQGFYTTTMAPSDLRRGEAEVQVAVRLHQPVVGELEEVADFVDQFARDARQRPAPITPPVAARIRQELVRLGYDGLIVRDAGGDAIDYVIALDASSVKVLQA